MFNKPYLFFSYLQSLEVMCFSNEFSCTHSLQTIYILSDKQHSEEAPHISYG